MSRIRRLLDAGKDVARGTATRVGSVGGKSETTIAPGTSTRAVGRGYGVRQRGQGSRAATRSQRGAATRRGTTRIAGGAAAAGGTGVALSGSGKTEGKTEEKKDDKKIKYNVGVSRGGVPFAEAFDYYRNEKKQKTFTWNDKKYTTKLKEEKKSDKKPEKKAKGLRKFLLGEDGKFGGKRGAIDFLPGKSRPGRKDKDDKKASGNKKTAGERFRDKKAGGGIMVKKFDQGGSATEEPSEKSIGAKRHAKRVEAQMAEIERIRKNNKKKVPNKKRPTAKSLKARQAKEKQKEERRKRAEEARLAEITISKDRVGSSRGGRVPKEGMKERFLQGLKSRNKKPLMNRGGMMKKKGYAKGGMTKKGYAKGGSVRGKPRGVGAALRGYGKALK